MDLNLTMAACISPPLQFEYQEGTVPLRFLRLKHNNVRQNITYSCDSGVDSFMLVELLGGNGNVISFSDKTVRMISQVSLQISIADKLER